MGGIRVMIVDDSAVFRGFWAGLLSNESDMEVVTTAVHGRDALERLEGRKIDLVILDVEMPEMDGIQAIPLLLKARPGIKILMASSHTRQGSEATWASLNAGAHDFIPKPSSMLAGAGVEETRRELLAKVRALGHRPEQTTPLRVDPFPSESSGPRQIPEILLIGSSTGGPQALSVLLKDLIPGLSLPVLIVQHMAPSFTALLAEQIGRDTGRECREARHGDRLKPGVILLAPGGKHLVLDRDVKGGILRLTEDEPENYCRPAVDVLFRSAAAVFGNAVLAVVLTGMGEDGKAGAEAVRATGGSIIVQDEASSVVWGMPGAVARAGLADRIVPISEMAETVLRWCKK